MSDKSIEIKFTLPPEMVKAIQDLLVFLQAEAPDVEPRKTEIIVEEVCKVCGHYVTVGYFHARCYRYVDGPAAIEDQSDLAEYE